MDEKLINELRFLEISDISKTIDSICKFLEEASIPQGKIILSKLPEIIGKGNEKLIRELSIKMDEDKELIPQIVEVFGSLTLSAELSEKARKSVVEKLKSADLKDLPHLIKFLLQNTPSKDLALIIPQIREKINLSDVKDKSEEEKRKKGFDLRKYEEDNTNKKLIFEFLFASIKFNSKIANQFYKQVEKDGESEVKEIDIWILLMLHSLEKFRKKLDSLVRKKVTLGIFKSSHFKNTFSNHASILVDYFESASLMGALLLRSIEYEHQQVGAVIYQSSFLSFTDDFHRKEILMNIMVHIGSTSEKEIALGLESLLFLSKQKGNPLKAYSSFVFSIFDYIEKFSFANVRKTFQIFCSFVYDIPPLSPSSSSSQKMLSSQSIPDPLKSIDNNTWNQLTLLIQKQIANPNFQYKYMAIIGIVSIFSHFSLQRNFIGQFNPVYLNSAHSEEDDDQEEEEEEEDQRIILFQNFSLFLFYFIIFIISLLY